MKHLSMNALRGSVAITRKGEEDDPVNVVTKALDDLTKSVDERIKAVESKGVDPKLDERSRLWRRRRTAPATARKPRPNRPKSGRRSAPISGWVSRRRWKSSRP